MKTDFDIKSKALPVELRLANNSHFYVFKGLNSVITGYIAHNQCMLYCLQEKVEGELPVPRKWNLWTKETILTE